MATSTTNLGAAAADHQTCGVAIGDYAIHHARAEDLPGVVEVASASFDHWPPCETRATPLEYAQWFASQPAIGGEHHPTGRDEYPSMCVATTEDGRVVGLRSRIRRIWWLQGEPVLGRVGATSAVDPAFRGRRLSSMIQDWDKGHTAHGLSLSISLAPQKHENGRADIDPGPQLRRYAQVLDVLASARVRPGSTLPALPGYAWLWLQSRRRRTRPPAVPRLWLRAVDGFPEAVDELFEAARHDFDVILNRDAAYLNWRYLDRRAGGFAACVAEEDGRLVGYVVTTVAQGRGHIVDILALPGRPDVVRALTEHALRRFRALRLAGAEYVLPEHHAYAEAMASAGFTPLGSRSALLQESASFQAIALPDERIEFLADPSTRIHLLAGDWNEI